MPTLYYSRAVHADWSIGLAVNSPFSLKTNYDPAWIGRLQCVQSSLKTIAITPSVAYRINDVVSAGVGVTAQYADAQLTSASSLRGPLAKAKGDDWGFGWNAGLLAQPVPDYASASTIAPQSAFRSKVPSPFAVALPRRTRRV